MANPLGRDAGATLSKILGKTATTAEKELPVATAGKSGPSSLSEQIRGVRGKLAKEPTEEALKELRDRGVTIGPDTMQQLQTISLENPKATPKEIAQKYLGFSSSGTISTVKPTEATPPATLADRVKKPTEPAKEPTPEPENQWAGFADDELPIRPIDENEVVSSGLEGVVRRPDEDIVGRGAGEPVQESLPPIKEPTKQQPLPEDETTQWAGYRGQDQEVELGIEPADLSSLARTPEVEAPSGAGGFAPETTAARKVEPGMRLRTKAGLAGTVLGTTAAGAVLLKDDETGETAVVPAAEVTEEQQPVTPPAPAKQPTTTVAAALKAPSEEKRAVEPTKEPNAKVAAAQASFPNNLTALLEADLKLSDSLTGGGKPVDRSTIKEAMDKLTQVGNELEIMYDGKVPPELADVARARRDAFKAYKEQARVNDWLSIVDRAIGAIGQFASAQAAMGTPYVGNYKPSTIDYDAKTQQALREYQAEVGLLQQEREESEQARSRFFKEKEMTADQLYKKYQLGLEKAKLEVAEKQEIQDQADKRSKVFFDALQDGRRENKRLLQATQEFQQKQAAAAEKQTADTQKELFTATSNLLKEQASQLENEIKKTEGYIAAATEYADKDSPENRAAFAKAHGKDIEGEVKKIDTFSTTEAGIRKNILQGASAEASTKLEQLRKDLETIQKRQVKLLQGRVTGEAPASTPGQAPSGGGTVSKQAVMDAVKSQPGYTYEKAKQYYESLGYTVVE